MPTYEYAIGKGLREPVSPYRQAYFFGAPLGEPNASGWNAIPTIVDPTTNFNLSALIPGHEVVVALLGIRSTLAGVYHVNFKWYRSRDNALLYDYTFDATAPAGGDLYAYSYIGYVDWEISENGEYRVAISVTGPSSYSRAPSFSVSGIPEIPEPEPVPANFMEGITTRLALATDFFYSAYIEVSSWPWPFNLLVGPLWGLAVAFDWLTAHFADFGGWVSTISAEVLLILSFSDITSYFRDIFAAALDAWDWVKASFWNVWGTVDSWWASTKPTVQGWIDIATQGFDSLQVAWSNFWNITWPGLTGNLARLRAEWDYFWRVTYPTLVDVQWAWSWWTGRLTEVGDLINSKFKEAAPLWEGWQDMRAQVVEFFTDPLDWIKAHVIEPIVDDFNKGFDRGISGEEE